MGSGMPEVLFIAYDFPPSAGVGAGLRSASFARYLPEFGWQATVVALDEGQAASDQVVRLSSATPWHRPYEMTPYGWAFALARHLRGLADRRFDLVYVSCPPYPQALVAMRYALSRDLPLVVDFRDAWALDPYQEGSRLKRALYRYLFPSLERRLVAHTDLLILNTPSALAAYQAHYPAYADRMLYLPNGYDEAAFQNAGPVRVDDPEVLTLLYAGRFGIGARSPSNLIAGLRIAQSKGCRVRLDILGDQSAAIRAQIAVEGAGDLVRLQGEVDYSQAVQDMMAADALVLIQAPSSSRVQAVAGKTFDYIRSGRPILVVAPAGDNLDLIRVHAGRHEHAEDTPEAIAGGIVRLYQAWNSGGLDRSQSPSREFTGRFERRALTAALASRFDQLTGRGRG